MSVFTDVRSRVTRLARAEKERYSDGEERPLGGYLAAMGAYAAVTGTLAIITRLTRRDLPDGLAMKDLLLSATATHKLSRLITKDPVTSPLRAPFTVRPGRAGQAQGGGPRARRAKGRRGAPHLSVLPGPMGRDWPDGRLHLPAAGDQARRRHPSRAVRCGPAPIRLCHAAGAGAVLALLGAFLGNSVRCLQQPQGSDQADAADDVAQRRPAQRASQSRQL